MLSLHLILGIASTLLVLVLPEVVRYFFDVILPQGLQSQVLPAIAIAAAALGIRQILLGLKALVHRHYEQKVLYDLRRELSDHLLTLPISHYRETDTGEMMTRIGEDIPAIERVLVEGIEQGITAVIQFLLVLSMMLWISPALSVFALLPLPLILIGTQIYHRRTKAKTELVREATSKLNSVFHDQVSGIEQIKLQHAYTKTQQTFASRAQEVRDAQWRLLKNFSIYVPSMNFLGELGLLSVIGMGTWWCLDGSLTVGAVLSVIFMLGFLYEPITRLHSLHQVFLSGLVSARRVFKLIDAPSEVHLKNGLPVQINHQEPAIQFQQVNYSYVKKDGSRFPVLQNFSWIIPQGKTIALIGTTGSGKSTLLNLIVGFDPPDQGKISIYGQDITLLDKTSLRSSVGYVTQDAFLFQTSILENLRLVKPSASEAEIWEALKAAQADQFVQKLPHALNENVGENGSHLSGGERQRIALARAILKNPPILLLDEATAALDLETQSKIFDALRRLRQGKTTLIVSHHLETTQVADLVFKLENSTVTKIS